MAPSQIYVRNKEKSANEVGLKSEVIKYPDTVEEKTVLEKIEELNNDESVSGILVQLPLPKHIDKQKVIETITRLFAFTGPMALLWVRCATSKRICGGDCGGEISTPPPSY